VQEGCHAAPQPEPYWEVAGRINHHWTKNLVARPDGRFVYVGIGSNRNVGENGLAGEEGRAQIWEVDLCDGAAQPQWACVCAATRAGAVDEQEKAYLSTAADDFSTRVVWAGEGVDLINDIPSASDIIERVIAEAVSVLRERMALVRSPG
jgi:hypothetical protein